MTEIQCRDFAEVSFRVAQGMNRIRQTEKCCLPFSALEIFPFDHCLPGNLGAFKLFRDLHDTALLLHLFFS